MAALSLLLCAATCVLWVRSYRLSDQLDWDGGWRSVRSAQGQIVVGLFLADRSGHPAEFHGLRYQRDEAFRPFNYLLILSLEPGDTNLSWERGGFAWYSRRTARGVMYVLAVAPFWSAAAATAVLPLGWTTLRWRSRLRRGRKGLGLCPSCGYDLRATPNRCP
ncbi:MAG: hypothetical protein JWN51_1631, partial [Phycisphaerales bacterium]|nr:hypothetical protein [Phycisphaerales bacterium]